MPFTAASVQFSSKMGDVEHNLTRVAEIIQQCASESVELTVFPECCLSGYVIEGAALECAISVEELLTRLLAKLDPVPDMDVVIGFFELADGRPYNSAAYIDLRAGKVISVHRKFFLPTYGVFDESRFAQAGLEAEVFDTRFGRFGMLICEDVWHSILPTIQAVQGAQMVLVPVASPARGFDGDAPGNVDRYARMLKNVSDEHGMYSLSACHVGFEGGKGLAGAGFIFDPYGRMLAQSPVLGESVIVAEVDFDLVSAARAASPLLTDLRSRWARVQELAQKPADDPEV